MKELFYSRSLVSFRPWNDYLCTEWLLINNVEAGERDM